MQEKAFSKKKTYGPKEHGHIGGRGFKGTMAKKTTSYALQSNHFALNIVNPMLKVHIYSIDVMPKLPDCEKAFLTEQIMENLDFEVKKVFGNLNMTTSSCCLYSLNYVKDEVDFKTKLGETTYLVTLRHADHFNLNSERLEVQQYINSSIKQIFKGYLGLSALGKSGNLYNFNDIRSVKKLNVLTGFHTSAKPCQDGLMLIVEPINKLMVRDNMLDHLNFLVRVKKIPHAKLAEPLSKMIVTANYGKHRSYRLCGIDVHKTPEKYYLPGTDTNLLNYYWNNYKIKIQVKNQPLLIAKISAKLDDTIYLVPELCTNAFMPSKMRNDRRLMQDASKLKVGMPYQQEAKVAELLSEISHRPDILKALNNCGLSISDKPLIVEGEVMKDVCLQNGSQANRANMQKSKKNLVLEKEEWVFVYPGRHYWAADKLYNSLVHLGRENGIILGEPTWGELETTELEEYKACMRKLVKPHHKMVLVLIDRDRYYEPLKQVCVNELGVLSQFFKKETIKHSTGPALSILFQMYAKLGGDLYELKLPSEIKKGQTMIIGYDVSHKADVSMVGFCASINAKMTQYFSDYFETTAMLEVVDNIHLRIQEAITQFKKQNKGNRPKTMIVFRDGVGESYFDTIMEGEIRKILKTFSDIDICFLTINKRTHQRFFYREGKQIHNAQPGTAILSKVVNEHSGLSSEEQKEGTSEAFDFFLIPHQCTIGVAKATHFHVIHNSTHLTKKNIIEMSHAFCYYYFNWAGAVRIPSACMYAHKLSLFASTVKKNASPNLRNNLFYL